MRARSMLLTAVALTVMAAGPAEAKKKKNQPPPVPVHAVFASARYLTPKVRAFIDLASASFPEVLDRPMAHQREVDRTDGR